MFVLYICFSADVESQSDGTYTFPLQEDGNVCNTDVLLEPQDIVGGQACVNVGWVHQSSGISSCSSVIILFVSQMSMIETGRTVWC